MPLCSNFYHALSGGYLAGVVKWRTGRAWVLRTSGPVTLVNWSALKADVRHAHGPAGQGTRAITVRLFRRFLITRLQPSVHDVERREIHGGDDRPPTRPTPCEGPSSASWLAALQASLSRRRNYRGIPAGGRTRDPGATAEEAVPAAHAGRQHLHKLRARGLHETLRGVIADWTVVVLGVCTVLIVVCALIGVLVQTCRTSQNPCW
ncbi:unnamed protein product [Lota lota]